MYILLYIFGGKTERTGLSKILENRRQDHRHAPTGTSEPLFGLLIKLVPLSQHTAWFPLSSRVVTCHGMQVKYKYRGCNIPSEICSVTVFKFVVKR